MKMDKERKIIRESDLCFACYSIQLWGLEACQRCPFRNKSDCDGRIILAKIHEGKFPKKGLL